MAEQSPLYASRDGRMQFRTRGFGIVVFGDGRLVGILERDEVEEMLQVLGRVGKPVAIPRGPSERKPIGPSEVKKPRGRPPKVPKVLLIEESIESVNVEGE